VLCARFGFYRQASASSFGVVSAVLWAENEFAWLQRSDVGRLRWISVGKKFRRNRFGIGLGWTFDEGESDDLIFDDMSKKHPEAGLAVSRFRVSVIDASQDREKCWLAGFIEVEYSDTLLSLEGIAGKDSDPSNGVLVSLHSGTRANGILRDVEFPSVRISRMNFNLWSNSNVHRRCIPSIFQIKLQVDREALVSIPIREKKRLNNADGNFDPRAFLILHNLQLAASNAVVLNHRGPLSISNINVDDSRKGDHESQKKFRRDFEIKPIFWFTAGFIVWFAAGCNVLLRGASGYPVSDLNWIMSLVCLSIGVFCIWHGMNALDKAVLGKAENATVFCGASGASATTYRRAKDVRIVPIVIPELELRDIGGLRRSSRVLAASSWRSFAQCPALNVAGKGVHLTQFEESCVG
jgi:hypothetical protein